MRLIRNLKHYRFQSVVLLFTFTLTFIISSFIPILIDIQQLSYVESGLEDIPIHLSYLLKHPLDSGNGYEVVERYNEVKRSFIFEYRNFEDVFGYRTSTLPIIKTLPNDFFGSISVLSVTNSTFNYIKQDFNLSRDINVFGNQVVLNSIAAQCWNVTIGDKLFLGKNKTTIHTPEGIIGSEEPVERNYTIIDVITTPTKQWLLDYVLTSYHFQENYHLPLVIVSNEEFIETRSLFDPDSHKYYYSRINVQLKNTIIDPKDLKGSISRMNTINNKIINQLNLDRYADNPLGIEKVRNIQSSLLLLQLLFSLLVIPSLIISVFILFSTMKLWFVTRKSELNILFRRGLSRNDIEKQIKGELQQFMISGYILAFIFIVAFSIYFELDVSTSTSLFILLATTLLFIENQFIKSRLLKLHLEDESSSEWVLKRHHYIIMVIGIFPFCLELVNFLTLFGFGLFSSINEIIQPFSLAIVIFTPIFSIYGTGILFFYLFQKYLLRIQNKVVQSFQIQDIARNSGEILQLALLLSLGLMISFGPIIASDMVKIHDRQQIQAYYGAEYSTGFFYGPGNYLEIKTKLDAIDNLDWSVVVESEGEIRLLDGPISHAKIFVASDTFFQMLMPEVEHYTKIQNEFESSPKNAFMHKSCLNKEFYKRNKKSFDNFYISLGYSYDEKDLSNREIFVNAGTFDIIPGVYIGEYGYVPPLGNPLHSYRYSRFDITIFTHLTEKFQNISFKSEFPENLVNYIFEFSKISDVQRNKTILKVEKILGVPIKDNYEEIKQAYGNQPEVTILVNLFSIIGLFNLLLVSIFLLVFIQSFLQKRKGELGVIRARGGTKITVYKLIAGEMLIIILGGIIWSFSHVFFYSSSIVNGMIRNDLFPPGFFISIELIFFLLVILIILNLIALVRPLLLFKQKILAMIQRRP